MNQREIEMHNLEAEALAFYCRYQAKQRNNRANSEHKRSFSRAWARLCARVADARLSAVKRMCYDDSNSTE